MSVIRAVLVVVLMAIVTLVLVPLQLVAIALRARRIAGLLPMAWHRAAIALLGVRVHVHGAPSARRPLLVLANHVSWLDIVVLGSLMPLSFIAKAEVAGWPVFGLFAKLQRSVFVERERRAATRAKAAEIAGRLRGGDAMVLFPEGTSSNGLHVKPFRTALVGAARDAVAGEGGAIVVQPLAIAYTRLYGLPLGRFRKPHVAWYGDMDMAPHLWGVLRRAEIDVDVVWLEPMVVGRAADRKEIAARAETAVREAVGKATAGRLPDPGAPDGAVGGNREGLEAPA